MCLKNNPRKIDNCMQNIIGTLKYLELDGIHKDMYTKVLGCCCGHFKYHQTIVYDDGYGNINELNSGILIPRKSRFYVKDKQGLYFIPEVEKYWKSKEKRQ